MPPENNATGQEQGTDGISNPNGAPEGGSGDGEATKPAILPDAEFYGDERYKKFQGTTNQALDAEKNRGKELQARIDTLEDEVAARDEATNGADPNDAEVQRQRVQDERQRREANRESTRRIRDLDQRESELNERSLQGDRVRIAAENGVTVQSLEGINAVPEMELVALKAKIAAAEAGGGSGNSGNKPGSPGPKNDRGAAGNGTSNNGQRSSVRTDGLANHFEQELAGGYDDRRA